MEISLQVEPAPRPCVPLNSQSRPVFVGRFAGKVPDIGKVVSVPARLSSTENYSECRFSVGQLPNRFGM